MHKKFLRTLLAAVLICSMLGGVTAFAESATVTGSDVNLRSGPGVSYPVLDTLPRGATVNVTDRSNGSWYAVTYNGVSGYMSSSYLSIQDSGGSAVIISAPAAQSGSGDAAVVSGAAAVTGTGYVSADYVRFRSGPGSDYSVITTYNRGKEVSITGSSGGWIACVIDGQSGWIYGDYISTSAPAVQSGSGGTAASAPAVNADGSSSAVVVGGGSGTGASSGGSSATVTVPPAATAPPAQGSGSATLVIPAAPGDAAVSTPTPTPTPASAQSGPAASRSGTINGDYVRFRTGPSTSHSIITTYNRGKELTITGVSGEWTAVTIDGRSGYVFSQYVTADSAASTQPAASGASVTVTAPEQPAATPAQSEGTPGYITGNNVRFRSGASMSSGILEELFFGNVVTITGTVGDWTAVNYGGKSGYVYSQYVSSGSFQAGGSDAAASGTGASAPVQGGATGQQLVNYALQYLGYRYAWGGRSPETGFDCSGFMYYVYGQFGYTLNRVAADQAKNGVHVEPADMQPGDLLCFYSGGSYIGHVGMYIGNNQFIHAATSSTGVIISELSGYYATRGYEVRRIV